MSGGLELTVSEVEIKKWGIAEMIYDCLCTRMQSNSLLNSLTPSSRFSSVHRRYPLVLLPPGLVRVHHVGEVVLRVGVAVVILGCFGLGTGDHAPTLGVMAFTLMAARLPKATFYTASCHDPGKSAI